VVMRACREEIVGAKGPRGQAKTDRRWGVHSRGRAPSVRGLVVMAVLFAGAGCVEQEPDPWSRVTAFGDPRPGLTADELRRFEDGKALFDRVFAPESGLGPLFNENQCSACHTDPAPGGTGEQLVRKATRLPDGTGACDLLENRGGENLRSRVTAAAAEVGTVPDSVPTEATHVGSFDVPFLFGLGAAEAVSESVLLDLADPGDEDGDGISGRLGRTPDGRVGRFGRKADVASLRDFTVSALLNEMGLTTPDRPDERGTNGGDLAPGADPAPDPEVPAEVVDRLTDYVRFLGVPPASSADAGLRESGDRLFTEVGCARCHVPELPVGPSGTPAVVFSDFLLHDLGEGLGGSVCGPAAGPDEFRTAPLIGLSANRAFLHDGRARSLEEAIGLHGGEASRAGAAFQALSPVDRAALLAFLRSL